MAHNLDRSNGQYNVAYLGSRADVWHHFGQEMQPGQSIETWAKAAGLDWSAILTPVFTRLDGPDFDHLAPEDRIVSVPGKRAITRNDTGAVIGFGSDGYRPHQPIEHLDFLQRYIAVDDRFQIDAAGALFGGSKIWVTAKFNGETTIAGDAHKARLLATTSFDTTAATIDKMTLTRVICDNTRAAALGDGNGCIRTTHRSTFDAKRVGAELAALAQSVATFKKVGDAMAQVKMVKEDVSEFFKTLLDIPFDAKKDDISTRKLNQFASLQSAYRTTAAERNGASGDVWSALQAVTRYVDHDRSAKDEGARFASANFGGGGERFKDNAMALLLPRVKDLVALAA
jgi:phage/plasmid-like protein (TIGR03299 family)